MFTRFKEQNWNPSLAERRKFGLMIAGGMPLSAALWFLLVHAATGQWHWSVPAWILGIGCSLGLLLAAVPTLARPFYCFWYFLVCCIDTVVSNTLLTVMFWGVVTPFGLIMRLAGRRPLQKGPVPGAKTYWRPAEKASDPRQYFRQF
jgi:hypothetical protein